MKHLFAPFEISNKLKEKGFKEPCLAWYCDKIWTFGYTATNDIINDPEYIGELNCTAPLYQQVIQWLKTKEVKVIENQRGGWNVYLELNGEYFKHNWNQTIDIAITEALKEII